jgi:tRNA threonylcarbamoyladenosine modification (KEOPS) complex  Pcc1 subunit
MFEFSMKIPCKRPGLVAKSLEPDIKRDRYSDVSIRPGKGFVLLKVRSEKAGHMKAIVNTYISLAQTLEKIEKSARFRQAQDSIYKRPVQ